MADRLKPPMVLGKRSSSKAGLLALKDMSSISAFSSPIQKHLRTPESMDFFSPANLERELVEQAPHPEYQPDVNFHDLCRNMLEKNKELLSRLESIYPENLEDFEKIVHLE